MIPGVRDADYVGEEHVEHDGLETLAATLGFETEAAVLRQLLTLQTVDLFY
ncbi:hypothetical protein PtrM4_081720 [Pyrenophora tritici-repentis]|uniref:Uncharacterized protein n=1 Tax=Pyrenophora tritici-repentis TaxID=45151 RepID=A0A834S0P1_9PLEO|nr:hypothetical protein A1F99_052630 [Pyrenophora tritici-repentis]KAF7573267.1 hypothetical protein PtrM4_081720 [Pyrenophora tritici-repentis]